MSAGSLLRQATCTRVYSRSWIAAALGVSHSAMGRLLPPHSADGFTLRGGGQPAWTLEGMPTDVRWLLDDAARCAGKSVENLLERSACGPLSAAEIIRLDVVRYNAAQVVRHYLLGALFSIWQEEGDTGNWTAGIDALPASVQERRLVGRVRKLFREFGDGHVEPRALRTWVRRALRRGVLTEWRRLDPYMIAAGRGTVADREAIYLIHRFASRWWEGGDRYHLGSLFSCVASLFQDARSLSAEDLAAIWQASFMHAATLRDRDGVGDPDHLRRLIVREVPWWLLRWISPRRSLTRKRDWQFIWQGHFEHWESHGRLSPSLYLPTLASVKIGGVQ